MAGGLPKVLEDVVNAFQQLPGIGKRTALRMALAQLKRGREDTLHLARVLCQMAEGVKYCTVCHNIADEEVCPVCRDSRRDRTLLCVVEDIRDVLAIENTGQYQGLYHVLGGIINPVEGIGPSQLKIDSLIQRVTGGEIKEVIMALNTTMEGDTTVFYLYRKLNAFPVKITTIARGISIGSELENADEATLARSLRNRQPFESVFSR